MKRIQAYQIGFTAGRPLTTLALPPADHQTTNN